MSEQSSETDLTSTRERRFCAKSSEPSHTGTLSTESRGPPATKNDARGEWAC